MKANRSISDCTVVPELPYPDVEAAADWLERAFGFRKRLVVAGHRIQMDVDGAGAIVVVHGHGKMGVLIRVADANQHHLRAKKVGAAIVRPPTDYSFGERQYTAIDPGGHSWTFSQTIDDVDPAAWGGMLV